MSSHFLFCQINSQKYSFIYNKNAEKKIMNPHIWRLKPENVKFQFDKWLKLFIQISEIIAD